MVAFDFVYRLAAYAEVLIWQFLDGDGEELFRDMGYLGGCCCQSFDKFFSLSVMSDSIILILMRGFLPGLRLVGDLLKNIGIKVTLPKPQFQS